jgi:hypothetical protein
LTANDTPGLLAMLGRALKSKDQPLEPEGEPVREDQSPPDADADTESFTTGPLPEATDATAAHAAPAEAAEQSPAVEPPPSEPEIAPSRPANSYKVSTDEARDIILRGLQRLPDFPTQGVEVKLYGSRPWGAMLVFAPRSTSHRNATLFRAALVDMVVELRKQIEIDHGE